MSWFIWGGKSHSLLMGKWVKHAEGHSLHYSGPNNPHFFSAMKYYELPNRQPEPFWLPPRTSPKFPAPYRAHLTHGARPHPAPEAPTVKRSCHKNATEHFSSRKCSCFEFLAIKSLTGVGEGNHLNFSHACFVYFYKLFVTILGCCIVI